MKIKLLPILIIGLLFGLQNISAQTETQVAKIRAAVAAIDKNVAKYKKTKKDLEGISTEGGEATFYSAGADLKKTNAKIYGEMFNATAQVYYAGNAPIFIYQKLNKYDKPFNLSPKVARVEETRVYYVDGKIIRILVGKKEIKPGDERFEELSKDFSGFPDDLFKAFKGEKISN